MERTPLASVLLYVPNVVCYLRLCLCAAFVLLTHGGLFGWAALCAVANALLDCVDGAAARALDQCTQFGAWLDVAVDCAFRSALWACLRPPCTAVVGALEWCTFACAHCEAAGSGLHWKRAVGGGGDDEHCGTLSHIARYLSQNACKYRGFWTARGQFMLWSLDLLPISMYVRIHDVAHVHIALVSVFAFGRLLAAVCEVAVILAHARHLLQCDAAGRAAQS